MSQSLPRPEAITARGFCLEPTTLGVFPETTVARLLDGTYACVCPQTGTCLQESTAIQRAATIAQVSLPR